MSIGSDDSRTHVQAARAGFTLIEVLIAVVVLATGLVLVLQGLNTVLHTWDGSVRRIRDTMRAQNALATARLLSLQGQVPASGQRLRVTGRVAGRAGLYHVVYEGEPGPDERRHQLQMLLYQPPEQKEPAP